MTTKRILNGHSYAPPFISAGCKGVPPNFSARVLPVCPDVARDWLKSNHPNNRALSKSRVRAYAADMVAGQWHLSDQPISFDEEGRLVNGQHRLEAVILSRKEVNFLVVRGVAKEAMLVIDSGKRRTTDEQFRITGRQWPRGAGATVRRIHQGIEYRAARALTDSEVTTWLDRHGASVSFAHRVLGKGRFSLAPIRAVVARAFLCRSPQPRLEKFAHVLTTGFMVPGDEAAVLLRNSILEKQAPGQGAAARKLLYRNTEAALWLFLREEKPGKSLQPAKAELFAVPGESGWFQN